MRAVSNADGTHNVWHDAVVKLLGQLLHSLLVFHVQKPDDLIKNVLGLSNLYHVFFSIEYYKIFNNTAVFLIWNINIYKFVNLEKLSVY